MKIQSPKAGIGTGRAGLQAASGLFSSAGLFQKGVKAFHPNDLEPYLLFDARDSMLGINKNYGETFNSLEHHSIDDIIKHEFFANNLVESFNNPVGEGKCGKIKRCADTCTVKRKIKYDA